jgi:hypothetical protein
MKLTRMTAILGLFLLGACGLYFSGGDGTDRHQPTLPDAGSGHGDCGGGYPDAGVVEDGGGWLPDGGWVEDGGGYLPDAGWSYDGGGYLPDAWVDPAPDAR